MASSCQPVLSGIFANNQYKPSIRYKESEQARDEPPASDWGARQPPTLSNLEVMEFDVEPATGPDPLADWRAPYHNYLLGEVLSTDKMEAR
jgi:hypothetical protein